jgi:serine protease AprX
MTILTRRLAVILAFTSCLLGIALPATAETGRSKLDKVLREARRDGTLQQVIVQAPPGQLAALRRSCERLGLRVKAEHPGLDALTVVVRGEELAALAGESSVLVASTDAEVTAFQAAAPKAVKELPPAAAAQGAAAAGARTQEVLLREALGLAQSRFSGEGISIAVVDSGIDAQSDVAPNVAGFWDFTAGGVPTWPHDDYGHGTHVAGLIASTGRDSGGQFGGLAPRSRLYGFKVLDADGRGRASDVVRALEFIVANRQSSHPDAFRVDIINLSLGHPVYEPADTDPLVRAVENAVRAGIVVVTSAGNVGRRSDGLPGYAGITSPGNAPSALTVGAIDHQRTATVRDDRVALFSSRGPTWFDAHGKPDVMAPGVDLVSNAAPHSALFQVHPDLLVPSTGRGSFGRLSGTSMAAAVTAGIASLVLESSRSVSGGRPGLSPNALKAVLQYTALSLADEQGRAYDPLTQGTGAVNPHGALVLARAIDTSMPEGTPWLRGRPQPQSVVAGAVEPWSQALVWADNILWGTDALEFNGVQWGANIVWGTQLRYPSNIVWGTARADSIVWGTAAEWMGSLAPNDRVLGQMIDSHNIVWGTLEAANIVWGTLHAHNIVWGTLVGQDIVWGTRVAQNIVWGTSRPQFENIVWGTARPQFENIVWGTSVDAPEAAADGK